MVIQQNCMQLFFQVSYKCVIISSYFKKIKKIKQNNKKNFVSPLGEAQQCCIKIPTFASLKLEAINWLGKLLLRIDTFFSFLKTFIGVWFIHNVLVSGVQHSKLAIYHIYIYNLYLYLYLHSFVDCFPRVLSRVPCAVLQVLISYLFYMQ